MSRIPVVISVQRNPSRAIARETQNTPTPVKVCWRAFGKSLFFFNQDSVSDTIDCSDEVRFVTSRRSMVRRIVLHYSKMLRFAIANRQTNRSDREQMCVMVRMPLAAPLLPLADVLMV